MAIWVKDASGEVYEFAEGVGVAVEGDGVLSVKGAAPDNVPLAGFATWSSWTSVEPGGGAGYPKGKDKAEK